MALKEDGFGDLLPSVDAVILDEAHQLPDLASEFFGVAVSMRQIEMLLADLGGSLRAAAAAGQATVPARELSEPVVRALHLTHAVLGAVSGIWRGATCRRRHAADWTSSVRRSRGSRRSSQRWLAALPSCRPVRRAPRRRRRRCDRSLSRTRPGRAPCRAMRAALRCGSCPMTLLRAFVPSCSRVRRPGSSPLQRSRLAVTLRTSPGAWACRMRLRCACRARSISSARPCCICRQACLSPAMVPTSMRCSTPRYR